MNTTSPFRLSTRASLLVSLVAIVTMSWGCGPLGPISGRALSGSLIETPVAGWSFVDDTKIVQLETNPEAPYSVNIWLTRVEDGIFVFQASEESTWVHNVAENPRVRVRIEGRVFERHAARVGDLETKRAFLTAMKAKYEGDLGWDTEFWQHGWDTGEFLLFRLGRR